jgi:hypothetical protein
VLLNQESGQSCVERRVIKSGEWAVICWADVLLNQESGQSCVEGCY